MNMEDTLKLKEGQGKSEIEAEAKPKEDIYATGRIMYHRKRGTKVTLMGENNDGTFQAIENKTGRTLRVYPENLEPIGN